tara:strand:+ start:243 stop:401 length:159 start_codon:yes stop_codon:yes gene_type:complete
MNKLKNDLLKNKVLNLNLKLVLCKDLLKTCQIIYDTFEIENKLYMEGTKQND